jgi:uncharacterized protein
MMTTRLEQVRPGDLAEFCRHHIKKLALFGSVLRADFRPDSDIDVLVEFEHGRHRGWRSSIWKPSCRSSLGDPST